MEVEQIELYHVRMPLVDPWLTAYGKDTAVESVLVRMCSSGIEGWGESSPLAAPCYSPEFAGAVFVVLRDWLSPQLVGQDIVSGDHLQEKLQMFKGNYFAKAALDTAWWDLHAKSLGQPLYRVLGGERCSVEAGDDFGIRSSVEELLQLVGEAIESNAPRVKLKYAPGWDLPVLQRVREAFPEATFHIDCNSGYRLSDTPMFENLDALRMAMFEQPLGFDDLNDHAELQQRIKTPICLDESIRSLDHARQAIALGACRWVNIKPGRVGGLTWALRIHDLFQTASIPCWVGGMLESSVGALHCLALATLPNFRYPADIFPFTKFYAEDLADPPLV
ncbi:MAG TPA: o-succinylbenzoate synthase, partial [Acidobacteriota bacterium]